MSWLEANREPCGYLGITPTVVTGITRTTETQRSAKVALITPVGQPVRYRDDGTEPGPDAGEGHYLPANLPFLYTGDLNEIQFIDTAAGASTVDISLYR